MGIFKKIQTWLERRLFRHHFIRFATVGGFAAIIDFGLLALLVEIAGLHYLLGATLSFIVASIFNFSLNKHWTYRNKSSRYIKQYITFIIISMVGLLLNSLILYLSVELLHLHYLFGKIISAALLLFWNYFLNKHITFKLIR